MSASVMEERGREIKRCKFRNASILVGEAAELIDAAAVEPQIRRRGGGGDSRRRTQWQAKRRRQIVGRGVAVR